jgi:hypothetical protein
MERVSEFIRRHPIITGFLLVGLVALVIGLIAPSFQYVEWNYYSLKRNTATNKVDYSHVYGNGRYFWGLARGKK